MQNLNFSKASATPVTKFANIVDILKMDIAISWVMLWGIKEIAVATTPESKLQNAGLTHKILVIGERVLNTPKKKVVKGSVKRPVNVAVMKLFTKYSVVFFSALVLIFANLYRIFP